VVKVDENIPSTSFLHMMLTNRVHMPTSALVHVPSSSISNVESVHLQAPNISDVDASQLVVETQVVF
jgi:hypothetical protein